MRIKRKGAVLLAAALVAIGLMWAAAHFARGRQPRIDHTFQARREPFDLVIHAIGRLRPAEAEIIAGPIDGEILWLIEEGKYVKKGEKLAVIDDEGGRHMNAYLSQELGETQADMERELTDVKLFKSTLEKDERLAEIELEREKLHLQTLREAPTKHDLEMARLTREKTHLEEKTAKVDLERKEKLLREGIVSGNEVSQARLIYRKAVAAREQADVEYELMAKGSPGEDIRIAEEEMRQAQIQLDQIRKTAKAQMALRQAVAAVAKAQMDQARESLIRQEAITSGAIVYAPKDGLVLYNEQWGRPEEGKRVWQEDPFLDIVNISKMVVETRVNEVDLRSIGLDQRVTIRLEAFPNKEFHGKVTRLAGLATDRSEGHLSVMRREMSGVMVFDMVVAIEEADPALRPTMTANLDIVVDRQNDAIAVPYRAVVERGGKKIVYVKNGSRLVQRVVETGPRGVNKIMIRKGIGEGEEVCVLENNQ